jgi:ABC-type multidrug transport system ATPase subunit
MILRDLNLLLKPGITAVTGQNGAGKSTFLKAIAGLVKTKKNTFYYCGKCMGSRSRHWRRLIGYLPQSPVFYEKMTVKKYLAYMLCLSEYAEKRQITNVVSQIMIKFDLEKISDVKIGVLSGGIKQRIALAQTLIHNPAIILLDEPMNNLDLTSRRRFENMLVSDFSDHIVLYAGHELCEMKSISSGILILHDQRGTVYSTTGNFFGVR